MYSINFIEAKKLIERDDIVHLYNILYSETNPLTIELGNKKYKNVDDLPEIDSFETFNINNIPRTYLLVKNRNDSDFNLILDKNSSYSMSITFEHLTQIHDIVELLVGKYQVRKFSLEQTFQEFTFIGRIRITEEIEKIFTPYWIQLIPKDLFERINAITPVQKLFENEHGVVMQLTEEPTSADNPEHLEKVIKIYEGLFPDFKADRTKLNELKAKQSKQTQEYRKENPKSFLSKLFGK